MPSTESLQNWLKSLSPYVMVGGVALIAYGNQQATTEAMASGFEKMAKTVDTLDRMSIHTKAHLAQIDERDERQQSQIDNNAELLLKQNTLLTQMAGDIKLLLERTNPERNK